MRCAAVATTVLLFAGLLLGQRVAANANQPSWPKAFDAVSIKPFDTHQPLRWTGCRAEPGGRFTAIASVRDLIMFAFNVAQYEVEGLPDWANNIRFSIRAVAPPGAPSLSLLQNSEMERPMDRALLQQYFQMRFHRETKPMDVLALVVAKGGPKLAQATSDEIAALKSAGPDSTLRHVGMTAGRFSSLAGHTHELASSLSFDLQKLVVDKTGLTGYYDFTLTWTPGPRELMRDRRQGNGPSVYSALQSQLGLRLKSAKEPVDVIAIDHIAPPATSN